ncbi:hypothetical protein [Paracraurococcus lichenis]|uniref:Uncharacterized protein n=1 Tax=Paracraurococcus lichenis TaxID=3064888 RepID=A0ABT9ED55_9PROT|nr:hypothetical protein [Paracraurococcus sp. LOR1-02]MDO9714156.1 hypothetical protein [Paracraurococcus sp. LOR1-02]
MLVQGNPFLQHYAAIDSVVRKVNLPEGCRIEPRVPLASGTLSRPVLEDEVSPLTAEAFSIVHGQARAIHRNADAILCERLFSDASSGKYTAIVFLPPVNGVRPAAEVGLP